MRNYIIIIIACWLSVTTTRTQGQELKFISPVVEKGIRQHLNINDEEAISFSQLDTITFLDLSRRGITNIQDLKLLPNLRTLDLSENTLEDLQTLAILDSLEWVDLSYNNLKSINDLFYSTAKNLTVDVSFNYIKDFSLFCSISLCNFTFDGTEHQLSENAPYFDVYQLYADVADARANAFYRGYTNVEGNVTLKCGTLQVRALLDGHTNSVTLPYDLSTTTQIVLSNGEVGDTTYMVPPSAYVVEDGSEITVNTGLPTSYRIGYLRALHGTVEADGVTLHYTAPSPVAVDTLYMSYYEGNRIKGFAQMYFMSQELYDDVKDIKQDSPLKMSLHDGVLSIADLPAQKEGITAVMVYDAMGGSLATKKFGSKQDAIIPLPSKPSVIIVEVTCGGQHFVTKVAAK